ncbi:hypothetical protein [Catenuloplanes indicus]|uniref:Uncharacterized protein n=1 Tax=Catenuloplanes indicus TaxID=137267 RepID=A0AAE4B2G3_9ACTN|nr:hypothetical protein [Catenuloplanes indicus]MDQ0370636.1 hypothetical protein [Catenuloplanes indicus]
MKFNAVRTGSALLIVDGVTWPPAVGDCFVVTRPVPFVLAGGAR